MNDGGLANDAAYRAVRDTCQGTTFGHAVKRANKALALRRLPRTAAEHAKKHGHHIYFPFEKTTEAQRALTRRVRGIRQFPTERGRES